MEKAEIRKNFREKNVELNNQAKEENFEKGIKKLMRQEIKKKKFQDFGQQIKVALNVTS